MKNLMILFALTAVVAIFSCQKNDEQPAAVQSVADQTTTNRCTPATTVLTTNGDNATVCGSSNGTGNCTICSDGGGNTPSSGLATFSRTNPHNFGILNLNGWSAIRNPSATASIRVIVQNNGLVTQTVDFAPGECRQAQYDATTCNYTIY